MEDLDVLELMINNENIEDLNSEKSIDNGEHKPNLKRPRIQQHILKGPEAKNAKMVLHEINAKINYKVTKTDSSWTAILELNGKDFNGKGITKVSATENAAEIALKYLVEEQIKDPKINLVPWKLVQQYALFSLFKEWKIENPVGKQLKTTLPTPKSLPDKIEDKDPVSIYKQYHPNDHMYPPSQPVGPDASWTYHVVIDNKTFTATGKKKKEAKKELAKLVLKECHGVE